MSHYFYNYIFTFFEIFLLLKNLFYFLQYVIKFYNIFYNVLKKSANVKPYVNKLSFRPLEIDSIKNWDDHFHNKCMLYVCILLSPKKKKKTSKSEIGYI